MTSAKCNEPVSPSVGGHHLLSVFGVSEPGPLEVSSGGGEEGGRVGGVILCQGRGLG